MRALLLALPFALVAAAAPAAVREEEDGQAICIAIGHIWRGTNVDAQRIREVPVPESYRRIFETVGCGRFSLIEATLIDWHLAFGDETTTSAALAYLAADPAAAALPPPAALGAALARAWPAGVRASREPLARLTQPGADRERIDAALRADPRIRRLQTLIGAQDHYLFLARQYLRASEFYRSPALLAEARRYFAAVRDSARLLHAGGQGPDAALRDFLHIAAPVPLEIRDVETRLAIHAARLGGDADAVDAAQALVNAGFDPVLRLAAGQLAHFGDFCDSVQDDEDRLAPIQTACEADNDFQRRLAYFWRNQAMLDLLMAADPVHYVERPGGPPSAATAAAFVRRAAGAGTDAPDPRDAWSGSVETALAIFDPERAANMPNPNFVGPNEEQVALHVATADMYARLAGPPPAGRVDLLRTTMRALVTVTRLAPAAGHPGRFRQAAARFLALLGPYEAARRREGRDGPDVEIARQAAYFRVVLAVLDRIAVGAAD
jgi:hypothetical protein